MQDQRALDAIERIDRALTRIEAATAGEDQSRRQAEELERVRSAHQVLRSRVEQTIVEIDRLLRPSGKAPD